MRGAQTREFGIKVDDQFGTQIVDVKKPVRLCGAVDKNGGGVLDPTARLTCYGIRPASGSSRLRPPERIFINNQFGSADLAVRRPAELCVPSVTN